MPKLSHDAVIRILIRSFDPIEITRMGIRDGSGTIHEIYGQSTYMFFHDRTELRLNGLSFDCEEEGVPAAERLTQMLAMAAGSRPSADFMADCRIEGRGAAKPNIHIERLTLETAKGVLFDSDTAYRPNYGFVTHPITPRVQTDPLERDIVNSRLGELIKEAIEEYENDPPHEDGWTVRENWPLHEFVAEYIMQRGAWLDMNYDAMKARPASEWAAPED